MSAFLISRFTLADSIECQDEQDAHHQLPSVLLTTPAPVLSQAHPVPIVPIHGPGLKPVFKRTTRDRTRALQRRRTEAKVAKVDRRTPIDRDDMFDDYADEYEYNEEEEEDWSWLDGDEDDADGDDDYFEHDSLFSGLRSKMRVKRVHRPSV